jgi:hypothetical protein
VNVDSVRYNERIHDFIPLDVLCFTRCQVAQTGPPEHTIVWDI